MSKAQVIWFTGLPSSGKTTLAQMLATLLREQGEAVVTIDGDEFRKSLASDLGFSLEDRHENIRRAAQMAAMVADSNVTAICSFIAPTQTIRNQIVEVVGEERLMEVYVNTPLEVCIERDAKGLYKKAQEGIITNLTGIDSPFEVPQSPHCIIDTSVASPLTCAMEVLRCLTQKKG